MSKFINMSVCTYQNGTFDVIFIDPDTYRQITLSGQQNVSADDHEFLNEIAPACVYTRYERVTPEDVI